jgi:hypothetical protein
MDPFPLTYGGTHCKVVKKSVFIKTMKSMKTMKFKSYAVLMGCALLHPSYGLKGVSFDIQ